MFKRITGARAWVLGVGGVLGTLGTVLTNAELAATVLPLWARSYAPAVMLGGFALALWALGTAEANPREAYRASVRVNGGVNERQMRLAFEFSNVGDLEAQRISIDPVSDATFPWQIEIREIGSLPKSVSLEVAIEIANRTGLECDDCAGKPRNLQEFVTELLQHHAHALPDDLSTVPGADMQYAVRALGGMWDLDVPMIVRYRDDLGRNMIAKHRVFFGMTRSNGQAEKRARVEFEDEELLPV